VREEMDGEFVEVVSIDAHEGVDSVKCKLWGNGWGGEKRGVRAAGMGTYNDHANCRSRRLAKPDDSWGGGRKKGL